MVTGIVSSRDLKRLLFSISSHVFRIHRFFATCTTPFRRRPIPAAPRSLTTTPCVTTYLLVNVHAYVHSNFAALIFHNVVQRSFIGIQMSWQAFWKTFCLLHRNIVTSLFFCCVRFFCGNTTTRWSYEF